MPDQIKQLGLIGKSLSHSFSKSYFAEKFDRLGLTDYRYDLFELASIDDFQPLLNNTPGLIGLNVTIPYKQAVIPFMNELSQEARAIGAVNVIRIGSTKLTGFNSDYYGFQTSLLSWLPKGWQGQALILGTGGASLAVRAVLDDCEIPYKLVSRQVGPHRIDYQQVKELNLIAQYKLIINTTPLGMHPHTDKVPDIDYDSLGSDHFLYDLVYNPEITGFMLSGEEQGARVKNGYEMLELQAEKSWEIWTS